MTKEVYKIETLHQQSTPFSRGNTIASNYFEKIFADAGDAFYREMFPRFKCPPKLMASQRYMAGSDEVAYICLSCNIERPQEDTDTFYEHSLIMKGAPLGLPNPTPFDRESDYIQERFDEIREIVSPEHFAFGSAFLNHIATSVHGKFRVLYMNSDSGEITRTLGFTFRTRENQDLDVDWIYRTKNAKF